MNYNLKQKRNLLIVFACLANTSAFSQNNTYDSLKKEVFATLDNVRYNFVEYLNRQVLIYPKYIQILGFDAAVLHKYSDTVRKIEFETRYFTKAWREKDAPFRDNLVRIVDEYAAKNNLRKTYKEWEFDKKDKKESGIRADYRYYDSTGHEIIQIYDVQKKEMNVRFFDYPKLNIADSKKRKEQEEKAEQERQMESDFKTLLDELDAKLREGERIIQSEKTAIAAGGLFKAAVQKKIDKVISAGDGLIDSFNRKYQGKIPTWMAKEIIAKWRPAAVN